MPSELTRSGLSQSCGREYCFRYGFQWSAEVYVGAYDELRQSGRVGVATVGLLRAVTQEVAGEFRPPPGGWTPDAINTVIDEKFMKARATGDNFILYCFAQATSEKSLRALLMRTMRNFLIDQAKATFRGRLRRRLAGLLGKDGRFERGVVLKPSWATTGRGNVPWQGRVDDLLVAAYTVRGCGFRVDEWNESGPTRGPVKDWLVRVSWAVLAAAASAVREERLAEVVEQRFPSLQALSGREEPRDDISEFASQGDADASGYARASARMLWDGLTDDERAVVPHLAATPTEQAAASGLAEWRADAVAAAVKEKLRLMLSPGDDGRAVARALLELAGAA